MGLLEIYHEKKRGGRHNHSTALKQSEFQIEDAVWLKQEEDLPCSALGREPMHLVDCDNKGRLDKRATN